MDEALREVVCSWLLKASRDLETARLIASHDDGPLDTAIYHCQQAGEKVLKCFLSLHDHPLVKTHDLKRLITICAEYEPEFSQYMPEAALLSPYAFLYRYPNPENPTCVEPSTSEFAEALDAVQGLFNYTLFRLPPEVYLLPPKH